MSMIVSFVIKDGVKGTDSNRLMWTASFPAVPGGNKGWGILLRGRDVKGFRPSCYVRSPRQS